MSDAVLIFTFSPIQSFITEARRTADLYTGSQILVQLAQAAGEAIIERGGILVYPARLQGDAPNVLVARVPWDKVAIAAEAARNALSSRWRDLTGSARAYLAKKNPPPDVEWDRIWERQIANQWETYWAAAEITDVNGYGAAYIAARDALDAAKRTRIFGPAEEFGRKDVLSGRRAALRLGTLDAPEYWGEVAKQVDRPDLRPDGRERLDAIGATKRFSDLARKVKFPSTSTVASADFAQFAGVRLDAYRSAVARLLGNHGYFVDEDNPYWPYDGDLLYLEGLEPGPLAESYGLTKPDLDPLLLQKAKLTLRAVYAEMGWRPAPYYAILTMDGDGMGERISACLKTADPAQAHADLSARLSEFAGRAPDIVDSHLGKTVYCGGDDVLALIPLRVALPTAQELETVFREKAGGTISAGIAIVHHTYPLGAALRAARQAEKRAKEMPDKAAVCVRVLKRSGETVEMRSHWEDIGDRFSGLVSLLVGDSRGEMLSSGFAYDLARATFSLPQPEDAWAAEVKRLLIRHRAPRPLGGEAFDVRQWILSLRDWATKLPASPDARPPVTPTDELAKWVGLARFVALHGGE